VTLKKNLINVALPLDGRGAGGGGEAR